MNFRISSSGTFRRTRTAASHIWALPLHVPNHCVWKPAHHPGHQLRLPPPHPHVLLSLQPVLCRHLFHLHYHPKDAMEHPESKSITYEGCITQMYFYMLFAGLDDILLTAMAYVRYVAIYHPLHYMVIMSPQLCGLLVLISWVQIALYSLVHSLVVLQLSFCPVVQIPHFFCELSQVVKLASSDNFLNNIVIFFFSCPDRCWSFCWHPLLIF